LGSSLPRKIASAACMGVVEEEEGAVAAAVGECHPVEGPKRASCWLEIENGSPSPEKGSEAVKREEGRVAVGEKSRRPRSLLRITTSPRRVVLPSSSLPAPPRAGRGGVGVVGRRRPCQARSLPLPCHTPFPLPLKTAEGPLASANARHEA